MSGMDRLTDEALEETVKFAGTYEACMARELLAHRRASQAAPARSDGLRHEAFRKFWKSSFEWEFMSGGFENTIKKTFDAGYDAALTPAPAPEVSL